jgi:drug/metabolite transporter (DMT)-like permease
MPLRALLLVLAAAAMHTGWNFLVKRAKDKQIFTWWAIIVGALVYLPLLTLYRPIPAQIWPYALSSACVEAVYYRTLVHAYTHGDFSLVYPVARGAAPALLAVWAILFLGERPQRAGIAGLALLLVGLLVVGSGHWRSQRQGVLLPRAGLGAALSTALCISIYSAIDGAAVRLMAPTPYTVLVFALTGLFVAPLVLRQYGYHDVMAVWQTDWVRILAVGMLMLLTYMLVLQAYAIAHVSYVGALREVSIVLAALAGWRWLGEAFGAVRTVGALLIFAGIVVIATAG